MNKHLSTLLIVVLITLSTALTSCNESKEVEPITINFSNTEIGISSTNTSANIEIIFSRAVSTEGSLVLTLSSGNLVLGAEEDFDIEGASATEIVIAYEAGAESVFFTLLAGSGLNIAQEESLTISLQSTEESNLILGGNTTLTVTFSENFIAPSGTIELNGGGATFTNQAFVDLSKLSQTVVDKHTWDLGFSSGNDFRIIVNSSAAVMARPLEKTDLTSVIADDTLSFAYEMTIPPPNFDVSIESASWVDTPDGNLETTAFGSVSATDTDNKVFIIKRDGAGRNWKKVRILQSNNDYVLQYADISSTTFQTITIAKDLDYNFTFADLDNGIVSVEPAKSSWDIMYSTYTETLNFGGDLPYLYNDFIVLNRNNTEVATVFTDDFGYEDFNLSNIELLTFESEIDALGENWRSGGGPTSGPALHTDRFFVIEDSDGHLFKLKFNRLTSLDGERGSPEFTFEIIQ